MDKTKFFRKNIGTLLVIIANSDGVYGTIMAKKLDLSISVVCSNLSILEEQGLVYSKKKGIYKVFRSTERGLIIAREVERIHNLMGWALGKK